MENTAPASPDTPPTTTPAAPPVVDPAAAAALAGNAAPKKGGRPKGSGDKRPRVRRKPASATASGASSTPGASTSGAHTFDGQAPGMDGANAAPPPPSAIPLDPEALAAMALGVGNAVVGMVATMRYPPQIAATVPLQQPEIEALQPILTTWLKSAAINIDPGTAFLLLAGCTLGLHVLAAEAAMRGARPTATSSAPKAPDEVIA